MSSKIYLGITTDVFFYRALFLSTKVDKITRPTFLEFFAKTWLEAHPYGSRSAAHSAILDTNHR